MSAPVISVLAVDDHPGFLLGLVAMVNSADDMKVIAQASDAEQALALARLHRPDIILMDLRLKGTSGVEAIIQLNNELPASRVIVITTFNADEDIYRSIRSGAMAFLLKDMSMEELIDTIREVHAGRRVLPKSVASRLATRMTRPNLTDREQAIVQRVVQGRSNKEIASDLGISEDTVKGHLKSIFTKLHVADRTQLAIKAVQEGIVHL